MEVQEEVFEEDVFEEEEEDIMESEEEEEVEQLDEMRFPFVTSWMGPDRIRVHGVVCIDDGVISLMNRCRCNICTLCYKPASTTHGKHQMCRLPCGHTYGFSCIKQKLRSSSGKCPLCNAECSFQDAILLYPPHFCTTDHLKASPAAGFFPFTKQGLLELQKYEHSRMLDAKLLRAEDMKYYNTLVIKLHDLEHRAIELATQWDNLLTKAEKLEEQAESLGLEERAESLGMADALRSRASPLIPRFEALGRRTDAVERLLKALKRRIDALGHRSRAFQSRMTFNLKMYREHHKREKQIAERKQAFEMKKKLAEKAAAEAKKKREKEAEKEAEKDAEKKLKDEEMDRQEEKVKEKAKPTTKTTERVSVRSSSNKGKDLINVLVASTVLCVLLRSYFF